MKKPVIIVVIIVALGIGYWLISPFFIDKKVSEEFPASAPLNMEEPTQANQESQEKPVVKNEISHKGSFTGFDKIHYGSGDAMVIRTEEGLVLRFEENFNVANGPDLYVGFGKNGEYVKGSELARLKGNIG